MIGKKNLFLVTVAYLAASCSTVETKRPELKATTAKASAAHAVSKKGKRVAGSAPVTSAGPSPASQTTGLAINAGLPEQLKQLVNEFVHATNKKDKENYRQKALEIVDNKLTEKQLEEISDGSEYGFARAHALYKLGEKAMGERNPSKAKKYFADVVDLAPSSDIASKSEAIIQQLNASSSVHANTVGAVLPLSGKNAPIGQRALRGLEMGLGLHLPGSNFKLAVMDSEGNPDSARRGVERLAKEDNVIAIVGSLLSKTAPAVAAKSDELGIPSIALSQKNGLTDIGNTVFRNSLTSEMQVRYLVRTAMEDLGMKKFAILYPNDPYGVEFANIFWDEVLARGGEITAVQIYSTKETDFRLVIQRLAGTYYGEARHDEFNVRLKELQKSDKKRATRNENLETVLPPIVDFDGIFIPDSAKSMGQIAAMLAFNDIRAVKLLGTNLWNTPGLAKRAGNFVNNIVFVDSIAPTTSKEDSKFFTDYKSLYNEPPSLIEIQAYDSGLILRQLISHGADNRNELLKKLSSLNKFPGALGPLTISSEREIERPLTSLTIEKGEIVPLRIQK